jgi:hypothetical protein
LAKPQKPVKSTGTPHRAVTPAIDIQMVYLSQEGNENIGYGFRIAKNNQPPIRLIEASKMGIN